MERLKEKVGKGYKREAAFVMCAGVVLSFNSGYIQGCCLSGLLSEAGSHQQSVSGVTGSYTKSGLALADGVVDDFGFQIGLVLSFMSGSYITGLVNPQSTPHQLGPTYAPLFLTGAALMTISSVLSMLYPDGKSLFFFACAANGLQNGLASIYSGNLIRLSHTGSTTDMGNILGQVTRGKKKNLWKLYFLTALVSAFWLGGLIAFWAAREFRSFALVASAVMFFLIGFVHTCYIVSTEGVSFTQALSGRWEWEQAHCQRSSSKDSLEGLRVPEESGTLLKPLPRNYHNAITIESRAIVITDAKVPYKVADFNAKWETTFGLSLHECCGKSIETMLRESEGAAFDVDFGAIPTALSRLAKGEDTELFVCTIRNKHFVMGPILDEESGEITHYVGALVNTEDTCMDGWDADSDSEYDDIGNGAKDLDSSPANIVDC